MPGTVGTVECYLEDHPMTCKWLVVMVGYVPLLIGVVPLPNGLNGL